MTITISKQDAASAVLVLENAITASLLHGDNRQPLVQYLNAVLVSLIDLFDEALANDEALAEQAPEIQAEPETKQAEPLDLTPDLTLEALELQEYRQDLWTSVVLQSEVGLAHQAIAAANKILDAFDAKFKRV